MQIVTQARGFDLTAGLREHVERRLRFALDWAHYQVGGISVLLSDINGPRGGADKRCRIRVKVVGMADVVIDDVQADLTIAVDRAVDRAGRTLARRLARQREHQHASLRTTQPELAASEAPTGVATPALK
ncbi:HPF/RaiA family ribosome-associated protein [Accumulibacter sp.]|uniref:HPF/RaiA family ribosome-associated protein n=1 Tax=Accumulibacter sp. TaxID=2053492 RepID=UPI0028C4DBD9|nr:HPF/RaiA family ribosome-associated protein [Accumulibacter sp.]